MATNGSSVKIALGLIGVIVIATLTISCLALSRASEAKDMAHANSMISGRLDERLKSIDCRLAGIEGDVKSLVRREVAKRKNEPGGL